MSTFVPESFKNIRTNNGTEGGSRTHTPLREPDFESGASANSATPAFEQSGSASVRHSRGIGNHRIGLFYELSRTSCIRFANWDIEKGL